MCDKHKCNISKCTHSNHDHFEIWFVIIGLAIIGPCSESNAVCYNHTVEKGETLGKLAEEYYGSKDLWLDIKIQNKLASSKIEVNQQLSIYVPDEEDWGDACIFLIHKRLNQLNITRPAVLAHNIYRGIERISWKEIYLTPYQKLEACRWATTTAQQESMFQFAVGSVGEIGMYQFRLNTARMTLRQYYSDLPDNLSDALLVEKLLSTSDATGIFLLHFYSLFQQTNNLWLSWYKYNGVGEHAKLYADKALRRYKEVKKIVPFRCK